MYDFMLDETSRSVRDELREIVRTEVDPEYLRRMDRDEKLMAILGARLLESQQRVGEGAETIGLRSDGKGRRSPAGGCVEARCTQRPGGRPTREHRPSPSCRHTIRA